MERTESFFYVQNRFRTVIVCTLTVLLSACASSDVLMTMYYGLTPEQRGLVEQQDLPIFTFPPDYISRLWNAIETVDTEFAEDYRQLKTSQ